MSPVSPVLLESSQNKHVTIWAMRWNFKVRKAGTTHLKCGHVSSYAWGWAQSWVIQVLGGQNCLERVLRVWEGRKKTWKSSLGHCSSTQMLLVNECMKVHSSITHNNLQLETTGMLAYVWINKLWYIHTMEYYAPMKMNPVLTMLQHG